MCALPLNTRNFHRCNHCGKDIDLCGNDYVKENGAITHFYHKACFKEKIHNVPFYQKERCGFCKEVIDISAKDHVVARTSSGVRACYHKECFMLSSEVDGT